ncbi:MAG: ABC transporter permease [Gemmatimonadota bacterium]|nr:ABC transporter permease [Gemmatimonadota bacterium]
MRLLPRRAAEELFEPAWHDLQIVRLEERTGRGRYALLLLEIFLDCWRLVLCDPSHYFAATTPAMPEPSSPERVHMILYHLRHAMRRLIKEPAFSLAAVLTLAVGVGANVAVFTVVEAVLLRPLPYADAGALVTLNHRDERTGITKEYIAIGDFVDLAARQTAFEGIGPYGAGQSTVYDATEPYRVSELQTTSELLRLLRVRPVLGRLLEPNDAREGAAPVVVLGYDFWQNRFAGDRTVLGRALKIDRDTRTIVGVASQGFRFPANAKTDVISSISIPL